VLAWLSVWCEMQTCIWSSCCHCHSFSLASVKSRLVLLPLLYRLTRVVPDKGPLNARARARACVCVCVCVGWCLDVDAYTTEDLLFDWRKDAVPVEYNEDIRLPEYDLSGVSHIVCSQNINSTGRLHTVTRSHRIRVLEYLRY